MLPDEVIYAAALPTGMNFGVLGITRRQLFVAVTDSVKPLRND